MKTDRPDAASVPSLPDARGQSQNGRAAANQAPPTISIVTACYNSLAFIDRLHRSLCGQTYRKFEWVTVDDHSPDATLEHLLRLPAPGELGMRTYRLPANSGGGVAVGTGIGQARGEIILIVDHDDELMPNALQRVADNWHLVRDDRSLSGLLFRVLDPDTKQVVGRPLAEGTRFRHSWLQNRRPDIADATYAFDAEQGKRFFSAAALEGICLFGATFIEMSRDREFLVGPEAPTRVYHRDNPQSQANAVKVSWKTVYTYARLLDLADRNYLANPVLWLKRGVALVAFSVHVHGSPFYPLRLIQRPFIKLLVLCLIPIGILVAKLKRAPVVLPLSRFPLQTIRELENLREAQ